jgi:hypothetical protein
VSPHYHELPLVVETSLTLQSGVDDMVGLLLSLSASPEELDILLISVTYGNVPLKKYALPLHFKHFQYPDS